MGLGINKLVEGEEGTVPLSVTFLLFSISFSFSFSFSISFSLSFSFMCCNFVSNLRLIANAEEEGEGEQVNDEELDEKEELFDTDGD